MPFILIHKFQCGQCLSYTRLAHGIVGEADLAFLSKVDQRACNIPAVSHSLYHILESKILVGTSEDLDNSLSSNPALKPALYQHHPHATLEQQNPPMKSQSKSHVTKWQKNTDGGRNGHRTVHESFPLFLDFIENSKFSFKIVLNSCE